MLFGLLCLCVVFLGVGSPNSPCMGLSVLVNPCGYHVQEGGGEVGHAVDSCIMQAYGSYYTYSYILAVICTVIHFSLQW